MANQLMATANGTLMRMVITSGAAPQHKTTFYSFTTFLGPSLLPIHMNKLRFIVPLIIIQFITYTLFAQSLIHNFDGKKVISMGGYYSYFGASNNGSWLFPFMAYQHNLRLDKFQADGNSIILQLGTSITPNQNMDYDTSSNYTFMLPGYVNPFITFYTVQKIGNSGFTYHANLSNGLKLLPYSSVSDSTILKNSMLQYYIGFGTGIRYREYLDFNIQLNRIFHDITGHTKENFKDSHPGKKLHGGFVSMNMRVYPLNKNIPGGNLSLFTEIEWRSLGESYLNDKTLAFGFGGKYIIKEKTQWKKEQLERQIKKLIRDINKETEVSDTEKSTFNEKIKQIKDDLQILRNNLPSIEAQKIESNLENLERDLNKKPLQITDDTGNKESQK
ncbi:hypothetical protein GXP67_14455 [Rhodocytophaga rosea]|uniref:Uncharacterized protein n=1 Tax=Rhodocytophaga rosea TaxID=2704465 RepID=A0A6C0GIC5_9BACT|nr:hypothetical protein [Rhodocytophaga rosea]QHT67748.1 hypothetical protein GXP67_14455 [Rhodocytophaga rosea]